MRSGRFWLRFASRRPSPSRFTRRWADLLLPLFRVIWLALAVAFGWASITSQLELAQIFRSPQTTAGLLTHLHRAIERFPFDPQTRLFAAAFVSHLSRM